MKKKTGFTRLLLVFGYVFLGTFLWLAGPAHALPPDRCPSFDLLTVDPGPNREVLIGTEVYLDARILEETLSKSCEDNSRDITDTAEVLSVNWEFIPGKGHVAVLTNADTLSPNFKAEMEGAYWLKVTATVRFVPILPGVVRTQSTSSAVLINARSTFIDLTVKAIEVTQAIQTAEGVATGMASGAIDLVALKDTVVRVYADITGPGILSEADVDGSLRLIREEDGQEFSIVKLDPKQQIVVEPFPLDTLRSSQESSLNFLIPANLAQGTVRLIASINLFCRIRERTCDNNEKEIRVTFRKTRFLNLMEVDIRYQRGGLDLRTKIASPFLMVADYLRRVYPVSGIFPNPKKYYHGEMTVTHSLVSKDDWDDLIEEIEDYTGCGNWDCPGIGPDPHFYGFLPANTPTFDNTGNGFLGMAELDLAGGPEPTAAGISDCPTTNVPNVCQKMPGEEIGGEIMAQEVAHNYGRKHAKSGAGEASPVDDDYRPALSAGIIGEFGFDVKRRELILPNTYDFMTYRTNDPAGIWVGPYTYESLSGEFPTSSAIVVGPDQIQPGPREVLLVGGKVLPTGAGFLRPMYRVIRNEEPTIPPAGHFSLELWDEANNRLLNLVSFEPPTLSKTEDGRRIFRGAILWDADTTAIVLRRGSEELQRVRVTPHSPLVTIIEPIAGATLPDEVTIKWLAFDADDDPLTAMVQYSEDGGQSWRTVGAGIQSTDEFTFDMFRLPGSTNAFLRVLVTDGVNTGIAQTGPLTVPFKNPTASIIPLEVAEFTAGEPVSLQAFGSDAEEGILADNQVSWESDLDGFLGTGTTLTINDLSPGLHTITFEARDSGGMIGMDQIAVQILPQIRKLEQAALSVKAVNQAQNLVDASINLSNSGRSISNFTPLSATFPQGTQVRVEAPLLLELGTSRLVFQQWMTNGSTAGVQSVLSLKLDRKTELVAQYVTQGGVQDCILSILPTGRAFGAEGGKEYLYVLQSASSSECEWTAESNEGWMSIRSGSNGRGTGTVIYGVGPNTGTSPRTGTLTVAGQTFTVTQEGCAYSITPSSQNFPADGGQGSVRVTASFSCLWAAGSTVPWISITSQSSGSGNGTVNYTLALNPGPSSRTGTLTIAGQTFTVIQEGRSCSYSISPTDRTFNAPGGVGSVAVAVTFGCEWTAVSLDSWITITNAVSWMGTGGTVHYSISPNTGTAPRTGTLTIAGQTFTVTQAGR